MGYQSMRYGGGRWEVGQRFNVNVEGARQAGFSGAGAFDGIGGVASGLGRLGESSHSVQLRGGVSF